MYKIYKYHIATHKLPRYVDLNTRDEISQWSFCYKFQDSNITGQRREISRDLVRVYV